MYKENTYYWFEFTKKIGGVGRVKGIVVDERPYAICVQRTDGTESHIMTKDLLSINEDKGLTGWGDILDMEIMETKTNTSYNL